VTERSSLRFVGISGSLRLHSYNSGALRADGQALAYIYSRDNEADALQA
jgi:hypothetical protein